MKKIILSIAMIASIALIGCSDDDGNDSTCKTCDDVLSGDLKLEVCDNGDQTISVTITAPVLGEVYSATESLPEGESLEDYDCSNLAEIDFDL